MPISTTGNVSPREDDQYVAPGSSSILRPRPRLSAGASQSSGQQSPHQSAAGSWEYPPPHLRQTQPSSLPLPASNNSSAATSMIGPTSSFYDPEQAVPPDTQEYQQWLENSFSQQAIPPQQMGYLRDDHGPTMAAVPSFQHHPVHRSNMVQQYQFDPGQYTPPTPSTVNVSQHFYAPDTQSTSHYPLPSIRQSANSFQSHSNPQHQGNDLYYYPPSSDALAPAEHHSQSYHHSNASRQQKQQHSQSANPSPYTPASEISVNLPATAPHSSVSPASWSEEAAGHPAPSTIRQAPYKPGPGKRDRTARKANPAVTTPKNKSRKRQRKSDLPESGESESDDESDAPQTANTAQPGTPTRLPGACTHCKKLKMKCDFPKNENTCKRCKAGGHPCVVEGRKPRTAPNKREYLLAQIRQKDAIIESLLKQLHNPYTATPLSISSYRMATSPSDQNNSNIIAWLDRLNSSVRTAGGHGGPKAFSLEPRPKAEQADSDNDSDHRAGDNDDGDDGAETRGEGRDGEDLRGLPDAAVPLGLIANLSLSNSKGRVKKGGLDGDEVDDDNVGVANETYFMPGPATDLGIRASLIEQHSPPEILVHGLVAPEDVDKLFEIFFDRVNSFISLLDPVLHTPDSTFTRCPFLFTVICAISSRYYTEKSEIYPIAMHFAKHSAANALIDGWKSVELCQAYILMSIYAVPARRWEEDRSWLYTGLAIRIATDLNLHQVSTAKPQNERQEREILNRTRVWLICFNLDRSTATQFGKPSTIKEDYTVRNSKDWYKRSQYNHPFDVHLCGYTALLRIVARFHEEIFSDPEAPTGLNKSVDFRSVTKTHDAHLSRFYEEWSQRFAEDSDPDVPGAAFRCLLLPFLVAYSRLVMFSFGFQQAYQRGLEAGDDVFFSKCLDSAKSVIRNMVEKLAPSGYMRYAADGHFVFAAFASAFLLKLLRPEFAHLLSKTQETEIFDLIGRLIQTLSSHEIAIDDRHTPKLYARFLAGLLIRHRHDGATTGRLHPVPPPQNLIQGDPNTQYGSHISATSSQSTFSVSQPQGGSQERQGQDSGYSHTVFNATENPEPIYRPEGTFALGGAIDFGTTTDNGYNFVFGSPNSTGASDEEMLATMQTLKNPAWWSNMMMPGFSWPEAQPQMALPNVESYIQQLSTSNLHNGFGVYHAPEVPLH